MPGAIAFTRWFEAYDLLDAAAAIPIALALGLLSIVLGRRARAQGRLSLAANGERTARLGRALGLTGFLVGVTGAMAVGVFLILSAVD